MARVKVPKDWRPLVKAAKQAGWSVEDAPKTRRIKLQPPDRSCVIVIPQSPSSGKRALENKRAELRRAGVSV